MDKMIAVIDDEPDILHLISLHLKKESFKVREFSDSVSFMASLESQIPDLILLDLMLPDEDGFDVCRKLKRNTEYAAIPIIMLTAKTHVHDKITGLDLGADDYVTKPFSPKELVARVRAVLRRTGKSEYIPVAIDSVLSIDPDRFEVRAYGKPIITTPVEFRILYLLASNRGRVFTRERILDHLWGNEKAVLDRTIDVHIKNLRDKLGQAGNLIQNIRGVGYKLRQ
jgi:DNA-binding response OmpR family regulator